MPFLSEFLSGFSSCGQSYAVFNSWASLHLPCMFMDWTLQLITLFNPYLSNLPSSHAINCYHRCSDSYSDTVLGYANSIRTIDGGTHIEGLKASLTRTINNLAKKSKTIKVIK